LLQSKLDGAFAQYHNEIVVASKEQRYATHQAVEYLLGVPCSSLTFVFGLFAELEARVD
jgi:hypothetical protein